MLLLRLLGAEGRSCWVALAMVVVVLGAFEQARADDTHHQPIFVGSRAMGMGTAFVGVSNDGSATYHNPAGMTAQRDAIFSGGIWVNAFDQLEVEDALETPDGTAPLETVGRPSIPTFGALIVPMGRRDLKYERRWAAGISAFRYRDENREFRVSYLGADFAQSAEVDVRDRINYYGLSLAGSSKSGDTRIGMSVFLSQRLFDHREDYLEGQGLNVAAGEFENVTFLDIGNRFRLRGFEFVTRIGWLQKVGNHAKFGLMLQPPGFPVKAKSRLSAEYVSGLEADESEAIGVTDQRWTPARSFTPVEARVGLGWTPKEWMTLGVDFGVVAPLQNKNIVKREEPIFGRSLSDTFLFLDTRTGRRYTFNAALGIEFLVEKKFLLRFGGLTDRSSARKIPAMSSQYAAPRVHRYGFSASMGIRGNEYGLAFGAVALFGKGTALGIGIDPATRTARYMRSDAQSRTIVFQITGATAAIKFVARGATDSLMR